MQSEILTQKITETLQMCEVKFKLSDKKSDFSSKEIETTLMPLLKEKFDHKIQESQLEMALGALNAGIKHMNLT